ncbi:uncharacterized protein LOC143016205 [Genypterus blacodes]|uniref:uncharacterized protein LOC143016205 n=1 Tax=Genypterus blacodes TaxID=154954 RepID=UPI003F777F1D
MDSAGSPTIGELILTLSEMGFTEEQIQAAVQAGNLSIQAAAEWILQGQYPRHRLSKQASGPAETAFSAFNPPRGDPAHQSRSEPHQDPADTEGRPSLVLRPSQPDPPALESRIKQDKSDFEEQERQRVAQEARAERRQKKQERELVLKRIAEDRKSLQEKIQTSAATETSPSAGQGQKLGGQIETNVGDNTCILMIRLPSGESMRQRFPADAPLRSVVEYISGRHPSLPGFALLQNFPRKRFGEAELLCSLHSLGLTPNAALCIQTTPPETPPDPPRPTEQLAVEEERPVAPPCAGHPQLPQLPVQEGAGGPDPVLPPPLPNQLWEEAVNYAGIPGAEHPLPGPSHFWGRGQKLVRGDVEEAADSDNNDEDDEDEQEDEREPPNLLDGMPRLPFFPENRNRGAFEQIHRWPEQGNRLREAPVEDMPEGDDAGARVAPGAAGMAAVERLQRAAQQDDARDTQGQPSPSKRAFRSPSVPSLCALATHATVKLMRAPSMQYSSSLAGLTPDLAELLLNYMTRERLLRPRSLELFFGCPIQKFVLNCYPYSTNELLRQLRAFASLKHLSLVNSPLITDSGVSVLSSLVKLQYLNLASCNKLTDSCLEHIKGLRSICFLSLDHTKVTDAGMLMYLHSTPPCLAQLSLNQTEVTEATLAVLSSCVPQLRLLSIKHTKVADVSALADLSNLQTLSLDGTLVTEDSLRHIGSHPSLSTLSLNGIPVQNGDHALRIISGLKLTHLTLPGRNTVRDAGMSHLSYLSHLVELDLTDYINITDQGIGELSVMIRLKKLSLSNTQVTDAGLLPLRDLQELQELCLDHTSVTSQGVPALITCLPNLQVLGLASTKVGDRVVSRGLIHCKQLVKINLSRTRITDNGLKFLKHMHLAQVNLDYTGVTQQAVDSLRSFTNIGSVRAANFRLIQPSEVSDEEWEEH